MANIRRMSINIVAILNSLLLPICTYSYIHPNYEACTPFDCGGLSINYPFFVPPTQPSFCGSDGFNVSCSSRNQTIIRISGDDYIINQFLYEDQAINITNSAFSSPVFGCPSSIHNLTLDYDGRFNFTSQHKDIILLQNCSRNITGSNKNHTEIKCDDVDNGTPDEILWAVYEEDFNQGEFGVCGKGVLVPCENVSIGIEEALRKGIVLNYKSNHCSQCLESGGRCGFEEATSEFQCFCRDRPHNSSCFMPRKSKKLVKLITSSVSGLLLIFSIVFLIYWRRRLIKGSSTLHKTTKFKWDNNQNVDTILENYGSHLPKRYAYSEIKKMTNSFAERLGEGGYGAVYKGKLLDGRLVAVKLLKNSKGEGEGFSNEVASIGRTNHVNVVTLLGFCSKGDKRALVYEFMENGSLEKYSNGQSLSLERLFQIMLGIARGLEYLHRGCKTRILHFDIKPHNILLDEEFRPKISDFGLAKLAPQSNQSRVSMSGARGTVGYIAPEVFCRTFGDVSHKSDVYSYGMMVLEVIGSRKNPNTSHSDDSSELYFPEWVYKQLEHEEEEEVGFDMSMDDKDKELKRKMIIVSLWCIQPVPSSRPSMSGVVKMLEASVESIQVPPLPSHSSPPRPHQLDSSWSSTMTS